MHIRICECMIMHSFKTINVTGRINISWGAIQLPLWFREQPY